MVTAGPQSNGPRRPTRPRRELPHNLDCEASILGGILLRPQVLAELADLETDDFYLFQHKVVFDAIRGLEAKGKPIDIVTLENEIERQGKLDAVGGVAFLGDLAHRVPTVDNVLAYRDDVRVLARERRAILFLGDALERAQRGAFDAGELISETIGQLSRFEETSKAPPKRLKLLDVEQSLADLRDLAEAPVYPTPFAALNEALGFDGLLGTQVYNLSAGTGRGKTTWVGQVATAVAAAGVPALIATYEMRPGYIVARKAAGVLGTHSNAILRGQVPAEQVLEAMPYPNLFLMHKPSLRELREAVDYLKRRFGIAPLLVVDYLQKLADEIALAMTRPDLRLATSQASATLCDIADRTGAAVIAVSAIGRGKGKILGNPRKLPPYELVEVAKESGAVEYDGAAVIVLTVSDELDGDERVATVTVAKNRFGEECHLDARYNGRRGTWRVLGRVELVQTPPDDGALAEAIVRVLRRQGPMKSKTAIWKSTGRSKEAIFSELDAMLVRQALVLHDGRYALPEQLGSPAQRSLDALAAQALADSNPAISGGAP